MVDGTGRARRLTWPELDDRVNRLCSAADRRRRRPRRRGPVARPEQPPHPRVPRGGGQDRRRVLRGQLAPVGRRVRVRPRRRRAARRGLAGGRGRRHRAGGRARVDGRRRGRSAARWLRHDARRRTRTATRRFLAAGAPVDPEDRPDRRQPDLADPVLMLYTAAFIGTPNGALLSHHAVLVQSLMMANLQRIDADYRYLNSGPAVPRRHVHDHAGHAAHGRHQRVHAPGRRRGAVPADPRPSAAPARS